MKRAQRVIELTAGTAVCIAALAWIVWTVGLNLVGIATAAVVGVIMACLAWVDHRQHLRARQDHAKPVS